jgi:Uma2 family endonuclease
MPVLPAADEVTLAPDWVCEVLSASTEVTDREVKMPIYEREAVRHVWLVDPEAQALEVFALRDGRLRPAATHQGAVTVRVAPFDDVELELGVLWAT